jgi:CTP synthase (UTP-ammonia lyase)
MNKYKVAILGNINENYEPHFKINQCFNDFRETIDFTFDWIPTEALEESAAGVLQAYQGIIAGSGPYKSKAGVINGIRYARKNNIPFLGTCSGFGYAVLEFGQSIFNLDAIYHPYENPALAPEETFLQKLLVCDVGMHTISFKPVDGTLTNRIYNSLAIVHEESHCVYGVNMEMIDVFKKAGLIVSGFDDEKEPKIMEYTPNDFFIIILFLPQLKSTVQKPHPLLFAFFKAITNLSYSKSSPLERI